LYYFH